MQSLSLVGFFSSYQLTWSFFLAQLVAGVTLLIVSIWLRRNGRPYVYTLVPMIFVGAATIASMLGEVRGYFADFSEQWLLAVMGSVILVLDAWVILEGMRVLLTDRIDDAVAEGSQ